MTPVYRDEFPILADCVYLNSNSTGAFPRGMRQVLDEYWQTLASWRDESWGPWWGKMHAYADALAAFVGGPPGSVVTDASLSSLLGRLGTCFSYRAPRNRIVTTDLDFPTIRFLWKGFARYGAELVVVKAEKDIGVDEDAILAAVDERTLLCSLTHASYKTGALVDVARVARHCHRAGALVAVDAYQSVGAVPVDVRALDCDFLLAGAHKWMCGAVESAFMYVRPELLGELEPAATGWVASEDPLSFGEAVRYAPSARRFATGTPQVLPCLMSQIGLDLLASVGIEAIRAQSLRQTARVMERADQAGLTVVTPRAPNRRAGVVGLRFPGDGAVCAEMVRRKLICSHRGALRIAPHFYNTDDEVERFMDELTALAREAS